MLIPSYSLIPRVSNSDLTRLKEELLGYGTIPSARFFPETARTFGRAFHQHLLEPETIGAVIDQLLPDLSPTESDRLQRLTETIQQDPFCRRYLRRSEKERVVLFTDPVSQVACKARLDLVYTSPKRRSVLVMDFKTTSARTPAQFLQSCYDYDYDRQVAFYLDALRHADSRLEPEGTGEWADTRRFRFVLIGIRKQSPHRLFAIEATAIPGFVDYGRKKYRFWLRKWRERNEAEAVTELQQAA